MTDAHRLFNIIDKRMAISYNSTELFIETGCIIEAETSAATSTPVSGPKPSILAAEARAACSKAESTEEEYTDRYGNIKKRFIRTTEFADFYDYDAYYFNAVEEAEDNGQHVAVLKARGRGYSFKSASMLVRNYTLIPAS